MIKALSACALLIATLMVGLQAQDAVLAWDHPDPRVTFRVRVNNAPPVPAERSAMGAWFWTIPTTATGVLRIIVEACSAVGVCTPSQVYTLPTVPEPATNFRLTQAVLLGGRVPGPPANPGSGDPPVAPNTPTPADGATNVPVSATLGCVSAGATAFVLKLGTTSPPTTTASLGPVCVAAPPLINNQLYYWQICSSNQYGETCGAIWSFTTVAASSTGIHPKLFITGARQTTWQGMRTKYLADTTCASYTGQDHLGCYWYKQAIDRIAGTVQGNYFSSGVLQAWLANISGNDATYYCDLAWTQVNSNLTAPAETNRMPGLNFLDRTGGGNAGLGGNFSREHFVDFVLVYDFCYQPWSQARRDEMLAQLNNMATIVSTPGWYGGDIDQPVGDYFGIAMLYYATKEYNPTAVTNFNRSTVGGITATGSNYSNARNMIKHYFDTQGVGGTWPEGSQYSIGTPRLAILGNEALKTTEAGSAFPEIDAWVDDWAEVLTRMPTNDGLAEFESGDDQTPRRFVTPGDPVSNGSRLPFDWTGAAITAIGGQPDNVKRQQLMRKLLDLRTQHGSAQLTPWWTPPFLFMTPEAPAAADLTGMSLGYHSSGYGVTWWKEGLGVSDCHFWSHFVPDRRHVDHGIDYFGDYQLYCNGEFVLTHPIAYSASDSNNVLSGRGFQADFVNATTIEGLSGFPSWSVQNIASGGGPQYKVGITPTIGSDYVYVTGTQAGERHPTLSWDPPGGNYYDPPVVYVHEHTRSLWALASATKGYFSVVNIERINAKDPEALGNFAKYRATVREPEQATIKASPRWATYLHPRTDPTIAGNVTTWMTPGGQLLRDIWLTPDAVTITEEDETLVTPMDADASEKKWRLKTVPNADAQWNCLMRVTTSRTSSSFSVPVENELTVTNNGVGVHLVRSGNDDRVVVANCTQSTEIAQAHPTQAQLATSRTGVRYRAAGSFQFTYTQTTATAKLLLADLNPALAWSYTVNGGGSVALTEDSNGLAEITLSTAEAKTIVVTGS